MDTIYVISRHGGIYDDYYTYVLFTIKDKPTDEQLSKLSCKLFGPNPEEGDYITCDMEPIIDQQYFSKLLEEEGKGPLYDQLFDYV